MNQSRPVLRRAKRRGLLALLLAVCTLALALSATPAAAQAAPGDTPADSPAALQAVVRISAKVPGDARTARNLGTERDGSGVVIDGEGLVLTIGYLILEAESVELTLPGGKRVPAQPIAYDHDTGFGLLRADGKLGVRPIELGNSDELRAHDKVLVASHGGARMAGGALVVGRRPFAGSWEYLLENAIFTVPTHPAFGGAALIGGHGRLLGIGSLIVADAVTAQDGTLPGNMFVPVNLLKPILADMLELGRTRGPGRPWLGVSAEELRGRLFVARVSRDGPAHAAGVRQGDLIVGVGGEPVEGLADFYRKLWAQGKAGTTVTIDVLQGAAVKPIAVKTIDRYDWLKTRRSY